MNQSESISCRGKVALVNSQSVDIVAANCWLKLNTFYRQRFQMRNTFLSIALSCVQLKYAINKLLSASIQVVRPPHDPKSLFIMQATPKAPLEACGINSHLTPQCSESITNRWVLDKKKVFKLKNKQDHRVPELFRSSTATRQQQKKIFIQKKTLV